MITFDEYQSHGMLRTYKPGRLLNHILGLCGEAGEAADMIKKDTYHSVPYKREEMVKELGDVLWYLTALAEDHGLRLADIAEENMRKLKERYPDGFVHGGGIRA